MDLFRIPHGKDGLERIIHPRGASTTLLIFGVAGLLPFAQGAHVVELAVAAIVAAAAAVVAANTGKGRPPFKVSASVLWPSVITTVCAPGSDTVCVAHH
jgi:hypothetical protein